MDKQNNSINSFLVFAFSPFLFLVSFLHNAFNGKLLNIKLIPIVMGLIAYIFPPYSDFAQYINLALAMKDWDLFEIWIVHADIVVPTIEHLFLVYNIPIEIFRFCWAFIIYQFMNDIYSGLINSYNVDDNKKAIIWLSIFMFVPFYFLIVNVRTQFVNMALLYCIYKVVYDGNKKYNLLAVFLGFIHFAFIPIILIFILSTFFTVEIKNKYRIIIVLLILLSPYVAPDFLTSQLSSYNFGDAINSKVNAYSEDGAWSKGGDMFEAMNTVKYQIYSFISSISTYLLLYYFIKNKYDKRIDSYIAFLTPLIILSAPLPSLYGRYFGFFISPIFISVLIYNIKNDIDISPVKKLCILLVFGTIVNIYAKWNCYVNGNTWSIIMPVPYILTKTYDYPDWCNKNLSEDFNEFTNKSALSRK